jgi:hypothetical protein
MDKTVSGTFLVGLVFFLVVLGRHRSSSPNDHLTG